MGQMELVTELVKDSLLSYMREGLYQGTSNRVNSRKMSIRVKIEFTSDMKLMKITSMAD